MSELYNVIDENGVFLSAFNQVQTYTRGEAIKKVRLFNGKIRKVEVTTWDKYQDILDKPEAEDFNDIDKAHALLAELLDDIDQLLGDEAGAVIENAISLIK